MRRYGLLIFFAVLIVYLSFPTKNYYWDGLSFAQDIEDGQRRPLVSPSQPSPLLSARPAVVACCQRSRIESARPDCASVPEYGHRSGDGRRIVLHFPGIGNVRLRRVLHGSCFCFFRGMVEVCDGCRQLCRQYILSHRVRLVARAKAPFQGVDRRYRAFCGDAIASTGCAVFSRSSSRFVDERQRRDPGPSAQRDRRVDAGCGNSNRRTLCPRLLYSE